MSVSELELEGRAAPLIAFTGINGAGKSTLVSGLESALTSYGHQVFVSKAYSDEVKEITRPLLESADDLETMFIFQALHRRQRNIALRQLSAGSIVLADRWSESYDAFHSQFGALSKRVSLREALKELAFEGMKPLHTFYLKIQPELALERSWARSSDKFDEEARSRNYQVHHANYYDLRAEASPRWTTLDASKGREEILTETLIRLGELGILNERIDSQPFYRSP